MRKENKRSALDWINAGSTVVMAISTVAVVVFNVKYLYELQLQSRLARDQFVIEHRPSIRINSPKKITVETYRDNEEVGWINWETINKGGGVRDLIEKIVLLRCDVRLECSTIYAVTVAKVDRLDNGNIARNHTGVVDSEKLEVLKEVMDDQVGNAALIIYLEANYTIPAALMLSQKDQADSTYALYRWAPINKSFINLEGQWESKVLSYLANSGLH